MCAPDDMCLSGLECAGGWCVPQSGETASESATSGMTEADSTDTLVDTSSEGDDTSYGDLPGNGETTTDSDGDPCGLDGGPGVYDSNSGICLRVELTALSWAQARLSCQELGSDLVQVEDATGQLVLAQLLTQAQAETGGSWTDAWIGLSRTDPNPWVWPDLTELSWDSWANAEPNLTISSACAFASVADAWRWFDADCAENRRSVCSWTP